MKKGRLVGSGRTAEVFAWGRDRVLKLYQTWMPAAPVEREQAVTQAAYAAGLPVPETGELIEGEGRFGIVFERVDGISMLHELEGKPWKIFTVARQLGELHAQMHDCTARPDLFTQRQQIEMALERSEGLSASEKESIDHALAQLPDGTVLCHGDFHPDNILLTDHGPVIIDWLTGTRGHPLADVARTSLLFQTGGLPPGMSPFIRLMLNSSRILLYALYLNRYLSLHPAKRREIDAWGLPLMAARLFEVKNYPDEKQMLLVNIRATLAKPVRRDQ
jgi:tRNA A-37 threonylcarbamoyl transferase component Bud32